METSWGRAVGLGFSCQTMEEYIRDPRFKAWGLTWKEYGTDAAPVWVTHNDLPAFFASIDWANTAVIAQNAAFDVSIMGWHYDAHPAFIIDTLSMGRAVRGVEVGNSLAKLARDFGLPEKGHGLASSENYLDVLPPEVEKELSLYCAHDTWLCEQIFDKLGGFNYPTKELRLIDMTMKMYTRPQLSIDREMLSVAIDEERRVREGLLERLDIDEAELASNDKFAAVLQTLGVEPPMKISKTTGKEALALAKNDALFQALLNSDNEDVALLCEARLKVKSTTERTRAQRFLGIAERGPLPVPLSYYGARSGRWTAAKGSAINMQNLKRGSFLRKAIMAPEGCVCVVGDLSQIEPRVLAWLSDYDELLDVFRAGQDPYAAFGAQMFGIPGMTKETHGALRQSAKSALLGAGYQLGWASFASQLLTGFLGAPPVRYDRKFAKQLGLSQEDVLRFMENEEYLQRMADIPHTCTDAELLVHCVTAKRIVDLYRAAAYPVVAFWKFCESMIERSLADGEEVQHKCLTFRKGEIILPNGMPIKYPNLRLEKRKDGSGKQWVYDGEKNGRTHVTGLYGGKIVNNVTQGTARIVMTDGMLRVSQRYPIVGTVHDELIALAFEAEANEALAFVLKQMCITPKYLPGIPLAADGGVHRRYGMAKQ